jgi:hypothetical protein
MENIFKEGDKVYCILHGWGEVIYADYDDDFGIHVRFSESEEESFTTDGRLYLGGTPVLSFTEYTLSGFSQERPEELPNVGDIVWTRNEFPSEWEIGYFLKKEGNTYYISSSKSSQGWRSAGLEMTTTNPYKDEKI